MKMRHNYSGLSARRNQSWRKAEVDRQGVMSEEGTYKGVGE